MNRRLTIRWVQVFSAHGEHATADGTRYQWAVSLHLPLPRLERR